MPTPLIPQEIFLLERYSSKDYYVQMRDAWEAMIRHVEDCLDRFMQELPPDYRSRPLPEQPDIVWGQRVLPNFRGTMEILNEGYIQLTHGDHSGLGAAGNVENDMTGQREFSYAWFDEVEPGGSDKYYGLLGAAAHFAGNIEPTVNATWPSTFLTTRFSTERGDLDPPTAWPRYRLSPATQVKTGDPVQQTGIYLPDADDSCAQLLIASRHYTKFARNAPMARVGLTENGLQYASKQPTLWTLIERVPGETVPLEEGLGPIQATPLRVPAGQPSPRTGWWFTPAKEYSRRYFKQGEAFPNIEGSAYGATFWQWSPDQSDPKL